ncbi:3-oxoacyl-[acyl-carrier-protein] synthase III C-terminal domain-containing protein [Actinokineospora sp. NBRC 105648]|uniref:3-oxoacyl-[acyl-carrier-protein] synthase III C-terminal domain-containing protein n=1 Tax=Actinokineospora sp. NBRC 105648 TaxID=3032206 RepID=UPI0024A17F57|nr:3-oxoacyl-[acyl-carrier-protein] synthase III C-terminal domain-containing protein [Actinokineospora sp. NBRC 105648]GLZ39696.1 3-oxoacyl-ACP synthase [Actinokineospora sp. NBRC 105648]
MSAGIGIGAIACVLPERLDRVADLPEVGLLDAEEAEFALSCGIETVGVFDDQSTVDLAARACRELLSDGGLEPDLLLMVGPRAPETLLGSDVCHVQAEAKLPSAFAFTVDGLGCTGSSAAWALARDLLIAQPARRSVVITHASRPTAIDRVRHPVTVIGDGAYAMTVVRGGRPELVAHRMETDGGFHDLFGVDYKQSPWYEWREECRSADRYRFELAMHSRLRLGRMVEEVLAEAGLVTEDVAATLMQNVTASAYEFYGALLGTPIHPVCGDHLARYGHLGAMDVVLNLDRLLRSGELGEGDHVLVLNNSPVAAWAVTLWRI